MKSHAILVLAAILAAAGTVSAQNANPLSTEVKQSYTAIKNNLEKMADKMPEENYGFRPIAEIQTFRERVAHIADANVGLCARIKGEQKSVGAASKQTKADMVAALKASFDYCDGVFDSLTDADATSQKVNVYGGQRTKLGAAYALVIHSNEVYGYTAVYLRLKGIVPPSSEEPMGAPAPAQMPARPMPNAK